MQAKIKLPNEKTETDKLIDNLYKCIDEQKKTIELLHKKYGLNR